MGHPGVGTILTEQLLDTGVLLVTVERRAVRPAKPWGLEKKRRSENQPSPRPLGSPVRAEGEAGGCWGPTG